VGVDERVAGLVAAHLQHAAPDLGINSMAASGKQRLNTIGKLVWSG
jgi:hypothetical protein